MTNYLKEKGHHEDDQLEFIRYVFTYWEKHYQVLNLLMAATRPDIIYNAFTKASPIIMDYLAAKNETGKIAEHDRPYFLNLRASILLSMMMTWLRSGRKDSPDEIAKTLGRSLEKKSAMNLLF